LPFHRAILSAHPPDAVGCFFAAWRIRVLRDRHKLKRHDGATSAETRFFTCGKIPPPFRPIVALLGRDDDAMVKPRWRAIMLRKSLIAVTAGALLLAAPVAPIAAHDGWGHHGGWHHDGWRGGGLGLGLLGAAVVGTTAAILSAPLAVAAPPPVVYAPAPAYYPPPVVYAAPAPAYYAAPAGVYYYRR
jgi:hypothetical protein